MAKANYRVGYGRPPTATRFKPGVSGNPRGRPKKSIDLAETCAASFAKSFGTAKRKITTYRAIIRRLAVAGLNGNLRAAETLLKACDRVFARNTQSLQTEDDATEDEAILRAAETRRQQRTNLTSNPTSNPDNSEN